MNSKYRENPNEQKHFTDINYFDTDEYKEFRTELSDLV